MWKAGHQLNHDGCQLSKLLGITRELLATIDISSQSKQGYKVLERSRFTHVNYISIIKDRPQLPYRICTCFCFLYFLFFSPFYLFLFSYSSIFYFLLFHFSFIFFLISLRFDILIFIKQDVRSNNNISFSFLWVYHNS